MKSCKTVKKSRKCIRGRRKSDGKCKRKPGPKRSRKMMKSKRRTSKKVAKPLKRSRKCVRGKRKSDGKCKRKPGPKRGRKMKSNKRYKFRVNKGVFDRELSNQNIKSAIYLWVENENKARRIYGDISRWDVSNVTDMSGMFAEAENFNGDISRWDVSSVTDMSEMFAEAESFNGDISRWDVSNVNDMS